METEFDDYDTMKADNKSFIRGESYRIAPKKFVIDSVSTGSIAEARSCHGDGGCSYLTYRLEDEPDGWFVGTSNGEITGKFGSKAGNGTNTNTKTTVSFKLFAADAGGKTDLVEEYTFKVEDREEFKLVLNPITTDNTDSTFYNLKNDGGDEPIPQQNLVATKIAVGEGGRFRFAAPDVNDIETTFSDGGLQHLKYTFLVVDNATKPGYCYCPVIVN